MAVSLVVLVDLRPGVEPEEYEAFIRDRYAPVARSLPSIEEWCGYRATGLLASDAAPPRQYVVVVEIQGMDAFYRDVRDERMQALLVELHRYAELTQVLAERFA